ncbi:hypothetical protein MPSEU_000241500 [Mayamaea pseudoterrestris]|nr:hypothetical protein MPSEU_000241500 [Mayamaea pseudoterrestris]
MTTMSNHLYPFAKNYEAERTNSMSIADEPRPIPAIPSREIMQQRRAIRDTMHRESTENKIVHPHDRVGRSILTILSDRQQGGSAAITRHRMAKPVLQQTLRKTGANSPSTVCELSPSMDSGDSPRHVQQVHAIQDNHDAQINQAKASLYPSRLTTQLAFFAENLSCIQYSSAYLNHLGGDDQHLQNGQRPASSKAVSTISNAFSPDALTMASTHGDHSIKISCTVTGRLLQTLLGHPRTPWTVKYHPHNANVIASGCLGHQVRVWNWRRKQCLQMVRLEYAIISVSFHPSGKLLAIANGTKLHFWGVDDDKVEFGRSTGETLDARTLLARQQQQHHRPTGSHLLNELDHRHMLRCVHFPPDGRSIIIGGVNTSQDETRRPARPIMSFYLRLWDFDVRKALMLPSTDVNDGVGSRMVLKMEVPTSNPRTFLPRALLYNDGGFDVSPDGKSLCACAEFWVPDGFDSAMDLVRRNEVLYGSDFERSEILSKDVETGAMVAAALSRLRGASSPLHGRLSVPLTPPAHMQVLDYVPQTPPYPALQATNVSPPSPPGRRYAGGLGQNLGMQVLGAATPIPAESENRGFSTPPPPPPPAGPPVHTVFRPPHALSIVSKSGILPDTKGRFVPHVVTISLDTSPVPDGRDFQGSRGKQYGAVANGYSPRVGQILEACPLEANKASAVTCVKFSPSTDFCLIGFGVREPLMDNGTNANFHPVTSLYRIKGGMTHVSTTLSADDDVNIARFHPKSGCGFVYGTKQGRVRVVSPRPWNYYNL